MYQCGGKWCSGSRTPSYKKTFPNILSQLSWSKGRCPSFSFLGLLPHQRALSARFESHGGHTPTRVIRGSDYGLQRRNTLQGSNSAENSLRGMAVPEYTRVRYRYREESGCQLFYFIFTCLLFFTYLRCSK